jgi:uroporphyrinogen-III synthase
VARIVLTAPQPRARPLAEALRALGHEALELSFTVIESLMAQPAAMAIMRSLAEFDRVIFVSPTAIEVVLEALPGPWPQAVAPTVIGPGSLEALSRNGLDAHPALLMPSGPVFDSAALLAGSELRAPLRSRILIVRAEGGNTVIEEELGRRGARVTALEAYRRHGIAPDPQALGILSDWLPGNTTDQAATIVVTTIEAADRLGALADGSPALSGLRRNRALAIHPRIELRLRDDGWSDVAAVAPGLDALRAAIESERRESRS